MCCTICVRDTRHSGLRQEGRVWQRAIQASIPPANRPFCVSTVCVRLERVTETNELRIAVIGAGPAGVYSSDIFLRQLGKLGDELGLGTKARIDLFEKLPVPFGLVR